MSGSTQRYRTAVAPFCYCTFVYPVVSIIFFSALYSDLLFVLALLSSLALHRLHGLFTSLLTAAPAARVFFFFRFSRTRTGCSLTGAGAREGGHIRVGGMIRAKKKRHAVTPLTVASGFTIL